ncbi:hypothetical protein FKM82_009463 [Ascaphus truei]
MLGIVLQSGVTCHSTPWQVTPDRSLVNPCFGVQSPKTNIIKVMCQAAKFVSLMNVKLLSFYFTSNVRNVMTTFPGRISRDAEMDSSHDTQGRVSEALQSGAWSRSGTKCVIFPLLLHIMLSRCQFVITGAYDYFTKRRRERNIILTFGTGAVTLHHLHSEFRQYCLFRKNLHHTYNHINIFYIHATGAHFCSLYQSKLHFLYSSSPSICCKCYTL